MDRRPNNQYTNDDSQIPMDQQQQGGYQQNNQQQSNYQQSNQQQGGYQQNANSSRGNIDFSKFKSKRVELPTKPYFPVAVLISDDKPLTDDAKMQLTSFLTDVSHYGATVRYQAGKLDPSLIPQDMPTEVYLPFGGFDDIDDPNVTFASKVNKDIIPLIHPKGEEISKGLKAVLGATVSCLVGTFNTSPARVAFIFTPTGENKPSDCNRDTGYTSPVIKMAFKLGVPVANLSDRMTTSAIIDQAFETQRNV